MALYCNQENPMILPPYGMHEQETHRTTIFDCLFAKQSCFFSVLTLKYLIPLRWYDDAIMRNKRFLWRSYVEIQIALKLVVNEKVVKITELLKYSLRYFMRMF